MQPPRQPIFTPKTLLSIFFTLLISVFSISNVFAEPEQTTDKLTQTPTQETTTTAPSVTEHATDGSAESAEILSAEPSSDTNTVKTESTEDVTEPAEETKTPKTTEGTEESEEEATETTEETEESEEEISSNILTSPLGSNFASACASAAGDLTWPVCTLVSMTTAAVTGLYSRMNSSFELNSAFLTIRLSGEDSGLFRTWLYFLLIADLALVSFTIVLVVLRLTHRDSEEFSINRLSPRLLTTAILVNFSFLMCALPVDIVNLFGMTFKNLLNLFSAAISNASGQITPNFGDIFPGNDISALFSLFFVSLVNVFSYLFMWGILSLREAVISPLVFGAPLVFTAMLSPYWKKALSLWGKLLSLALLVFPLCGILIGLGDLLSTITLTQLNSNNTFSITLAASLISVAPYFLFIPLVIPLYQKIRHIDNIIENPAAFTRTFVKLDAADNDQVVETAVHVLDKNSLSSSGSALIAHTSETVKSRVDKRNQTGSNLANLFTGDVVPKPKNTGLFSGESAGQNSAEDIPVVREISWHEAAVKNATQSIRDKNEKKRVKDNIRKSEEALIISFAKTDNYNYGTNLSKMIDDLASLANKIPINPSESDKIRFGALARFVAMADDGGTLLNDLVYNRDKLSPDGLKYFNSYRQDNTDVAVAMQKTGAVTSTYLSDLNEPLSVNQIGEQYANSALKTPLEIIAQSTSELRRFISFLTPDKIQNLVTSEYFSFILSDPEKWELIENLPAYQAISEQQRTEAKQKTEQILKNQQAMEEARQKAEQEAEQKAERASYLRELEHEARDNPDGPEKIKVNGEEFMVFRIPFDDDAFQKDKYDARNWTLSQAGEPIYAEGRLRWNGTQAKLEEIEI